VLLKETTMPQHITRRDFLRLAGLGGGAALLGAAAPGGPAAAGSGPAAARWSPGAISGRTSRIATSDLATRLLVVLEMGGGNDGLSMAPPVDAEALRAMRPTAFPDLEALLRPGNDVVLHPALTRLQQRALTLVDGVGSPAPDLSHFEMMRRWWAGDPDGTAGPTTGFLGRLCDVLADGAPVTGLSIGGASTPALISERAGTLGLPELWWLEWLDDDDDDWAMAFRDGLSTMTTPVDGDTDALSLARRGLATGLRLGDMAIDLPESSGYPDTTLGANLALASRLIDADLGVRILHVVVDGDFDTHESHLDRHSTLMTELDDALDAFLGDLDERGHGDRVLVATTSEFGRRPEQNGDDGLDHGTASTVLLAGPVPRQRVGEPPSLADLDDDGNVVSTISMDRYYATLAESWFGIPASDVLSGTPRPVDGIW